MKTNEEALEETIENLDVWFMRLHTATTADRANVCRGMIRSLINDYAFFYSYRK